MERMTDYKPKEWQDLEELYRKQNVRINELEQENKKLKSDLHFARNMLDNVRAEYESLQNVIKELKEELKYYKEKSEFLNKVIVKYQEEN